MSGERARALTVFSNLIAAQLTAKVLVAAWERSALEEVKRTTANFSGRDSICKFSEIQELLLKFAKKIQRPLLKVVIVH